MVAVHCWADKRAGTGPRRCQAATCRQWDHVQCRTRSVASDMSRGHFHTAARVSRNALFRGPCLIVNRGSGWHWTLVRTPRLAITRHCGVQTAEATVSRSASGASKITRRLPSPAATLPLAPAAQLTARGWSEESRDVFRLGGSFGFGSARPLRCCGATVSACLGEGAGRFQARWCRSL